LFYPAVSDQPSAAVRYSKKSLNLASAIPQAGFVLDVRPSGTSLVQGESKIHPGSAGQRRRCLQAIARPCELALRHPIHADFAKGPVAV
jgi:hypothetical protein